MRSRRITRSARPDTDTGALDPDDAEDRRERLVTWQRRAGVLPAILVSSHAATVIAEDHAYDPMFFRSVLPVMQIILSFAFGGLTLSVALSRRGLDSLPDEYEKLLNTQRAADAFITSMLGIFALAVVCVFVEIPGFAVVLLVFAVMILSLVAPVAHIGPTRPTT